MDQVELSDKVKDFKVKRQIKILLMVFVVILVIIGIVIYMFQSDKVVQVEIKENTNRQANSIETAEDNNLIVRETAPEIIDTDGDGISDSREEALGINPKSLDTDKDGILDGEEMEGWKTDPLKPDTDEDGLIDYNEVKVYATDPLDPDTDDDGFLDGEEVNNGYNPKGKGSL